MAKIIEEIFFLPPMAVARLGGSDTPLASFTWMEDPTLHGAGLTVIAPAISLNVLADGSVQPFLPAVLQFRDGSLFRPVAPFFELWVRSDGEEQPLTLKFLQESGGTLDAIQYSVTAANLKAARRTDDPACAFSASIQVRGDEHVKHALLASSVARAATDAPLVSAATPIPLGTFQVIRPTASLAMGVDLGVVRVRFTPARGEVYGPRISVPATDPDTGRSYPLVPDANQILNPSSSWMHYTSNDRSDSPEPSDTYDGADDTGRRNRSFGVVDDTCDLLLRADVTIKKKTWTATARAFSAPPDFAPDRRPFYSLADELIDRDPPAGDTKEDPQDSLVRLGDLFQRVYETASLANLDMMRSSPEIMPRGQARTVNFPKLPSVTYPDTMTKKDPLFQKDDDLTSPPSSHDKVPYSSVAAQTHAPLADTDDLELFLRTQADRVRAMIRPAYAHFKDLRPTVNTNDKPDPARRDPRIVRDTEHDMRMPPYMRDSDATPLSLNRRQYEFLMKTVESLQPRAKGLSSGVPASVSLTRDHVSRVVQRLSAKAAISGQTKPPQASNRKPRASGRKGAS
jgi:hypothetical protein